MKAKDKSGMLHAFLLDVDHVMRKGESAIRLMLKLENGKTIRLYDSFQPYFLLKPRNGEDEEVKRTEKALSELAVLNRGPEARVKRTERVTLNWRNGKVLLLKVFAFTASDVPKLREECRKFGEPFEFDIPYTRRYLIDKHLRPNALHELTHEGLNLKSIVPVESDASPKMRMMSLDIETYNPDAMPNADKDPILMIGFDGEKQGVYSHSKKFSVGFVKTFDSERKMLENFCQLLRDEHIDLVATYNGDQFDLPYMQTRANKLGADMRLGRDRQRVKIRRIGLRNISELSGRIHYDVFPVASFLNFIGTIKVERLTLAEVYATVLGGKKLDMQKENMHKIWDSGSTKDLDYMAEYCLVDAKGCLDLTKHFLHLQMELGKLVKMPLIEVSRATASQLVETFLLSKAFERDELAPNKPSAEEIDARQTPVEGAFVKTPDAGVYEKIAVLDFRSLYPSIIISHNIDATTFNCDCCKDGGFVSPQGHRFCKKRKGIIPEMLEEVLKERLKIKEKMKHLDKSSSEYKALDARQWGLKILANSTYGYLLFARSRWYTREGGEATTAWGRHYVQDMLKKAEEFGLKPLYADSITSERFVTLLDPNGFVRVKNIEELFDENKEKAVKRGEKEVIPLEGWKALSLDESRKSCWKPLLEIIRHKNEKKIFRVVQKYGETRVTEDHSLMVFEEGRLIEAKPQEMALKPMVKVEQIPEVAPLTELDLFELLKSYSKKIFYKGREKTSLPQTDGEWVWFGWSNQKKRVKLKRFINVGSPEFESLCRLLGAYVAEGSSSTLETTKSKCGASISCSNKAWLERLQEDYLLLFQNTRASIIRSTPSPRDLTYSTDGFAFKTVHYHDQTLKLQMMNELAAVFFKVLAGQKSSGKKIPFFMFHVPERFKKIFIENMVLGDGSRSTNKKLNYSEEYKKNNFRYTTKSLELASGFTLLLSQLGIKHYVEYRPSKGVYSLGTSSKNNARFKTKIIEESYDGLVYDLSVEETHTFVDSCGQVLLHNTDSGFFLYESKEKVEEFKKQINATLPEAMQLELEGFYPRGIFVSKKIKTDEDAKGAKKKYALIDENGKIKIRGFELVRRDWSKVAKNTQRKVLEILLKEGDVEKAVALVKNVIAELKEGKVPLSDCVIYTQLRKNAGNYAIQSPELGAIQHARKQGMRISENAVIGYIVTKEGKEASKSKQKVYLQARVVELAKNYDPDYYINHQVMPSVMKILGALGFDEDSMKMGGKQKGLGDW